MQFGFARVALSLLVGVVALPGGAIAQGRLAGVGGFNIDLLTDPFFSCSDLRSPASHPLPGPITGECELAPGEISRGTYFYEWGQVGNGFEFDGTVPEALSPHLAEGYAVMQDYMQFGSGPLPTEIVFWMALDMGATGVNRALGAGGFLSVGLGGAFAGGPAHAWSYPLRGRLGGVRSSSALQVGPGSVFDFHLHSYLFASARGAGGVRSGGRLEGIQFFRNGTDISNRVDVTFGSGTRYQIGAPITPVPEPATVGLVAIGLASMAAARALRRRRDDRSGRQAHRK